MRALRLLNSPLAFDHHAPEPTPLPGEAVLIPRRVALAPPDFLAASGALPFRGTLGHEFVATVESIRPPAGATSLPPNLARLLGQRVVGSIHIPCAACDRCRAGLSNHCPNRAVLGLHNRDGCLADRFCLPAANLAEVPPAIPDDDAALALSAAAALHAAHMARPQGKPYVTILGDGALGLLCAQAMARLNASVRLLGTHPAKFSLCERWGIKHRHAAEVGHHQDQDIVVDCTGTPAGFDLALRLVRPRGRLLLKSALAPIPDAAHHPRPTPADLARVVANELEVIGSRCGRLQDALDALARGHLDVRPLISRRARADELPAILAAPPDPALVRILADVEPRPAALSA